MERWHGKVSWKGGLVRLGGEWVGRLRMMLHTLKCLIVGGRNKQGGWKKCFEI